MCTSTQRLIGSGSTTLAQKMTTCKITLKIVEYAYKCRRCVNYHKEGRHMRHSFTKIDKIQHGL